MDTEVVLLPSLKFPQKLWHIINNSTTSAISWSSTGLTVMLDYNKFQQEYLSSDEKIFKTNNITSFIRQLNMYGFRKVASHKSEAWNSHDQNVHEFMHEHFQRSRLDLLEKVCRKTGTRASKLESLEEEIKIEYTLEEDHQEVAALPMTRLQASQLALKETLQQAIIQYNAQQTRQIFEEAQDFDFEEFKFYFVNSSSSAKNDLKTITLYVPRISEKQNRDWYSEALLNVISTNF